MLFTTTELKILIIF